VLKGCGISRDSRGAAAMIEALLSTLGGIHAPAGFDMADLQETKVLLEALT